MFCSAAQPSFHWTRCWGNRRWCPEVKLQTSSNRTSLVHCIGCSMLAPLYLAEISPPELRGSLMALEQLSIVLGVVLGFWTGFLTRNCEQPLTLFHPSVSSHSFCISYGLLLMAHTFGHSTNSRNYTCHGVLLPTVLTTSIDTSR